LTAEGTAGSSGAGGGNSGASVGDTWDQKYFSQIEMSEDAELAIKDMMVCIARVAVRCLLSRDDVNAVNVAVSGKLFDFFSCDAIVEL
jgi:hypothetical protein